MGGVKGWLEGLASGEEGDGKGWKGKKVVGDAEELEMDLGLSSGPSAGGKLFLLMLLPLFSVFCIHEFDFLHLFLAIPYPVMGPVPHRLKFES